MRKLRYYKCQGFAVEFSCDLPPADMPFCPICGTPGDAKPFEDDSVVLCSRCGDILPRLDAFGCQLCGLPICDSCFRNNEFCVKCADKSGWLTQPTSELIC